MMNTEYPEAQQIDKLVQDAKKIVVMQADNPDGDSLASALALEQILGDLGKDVWLYCGIDIAPHLRYLQGWDRVQKELPHQFDLTIIVDTSSDSLFETLNNTSQRSWLGSRPCIVLDHHDADPTIPYATVTCNHKAVATGELIFELAGQCGWVLNDEAREMLAVSIMSDSLGLISEGTSARSIQIISELVASGVSLAKLESARRELMRKSPQLVAYKGELLQRIEYHNDQRIATVTIPWEEIQKYSPYYNPSMLVIDDMRMTEGTDIAISFKIYQDGKVTAKIRANYGVGIANKLAEEFGGGGHPYASGFKITDGRPFSQIKSDCIRVATQLLEQSKQEQTDESV